MIGQFFTSYDSIIEPAYDAPEVKLVERTYNDNSTTRRTRWHETAKASTSSHI